MTCGTPEQWLPIDLFGEYEVSNRGNVRNARTKRTLSPYAGSRGHLYVKLYHNGMREKRAISRMVLEAFIGPPPPGRPFALHIDDVETNNCLANLMWGCRKDNAEHAIRNGRQVRGARVGTSKLTPLKVRAIRKLCEEFSNGELAQIFEVERTAVRRVVKRISWRHLQ